MNLIPLKRIILVILERSFIADVIFTDKPFRQCWLVSKWGSWRDRALRRTNKSIIICQQMEHFSRLSSRPDQDGRSPWPWNVTIAFTSLMKHFCDSSYFIFVSFGWTLFLFIIDLGSSVFVFVFRRSTDRNMWFPDDQCCILILPVVCVAAAAGAGGAGGGAGGPAELEEAAGGEGLQ